MTYDRKLLPRRRLPLVAATAASLGAGLMAGLQRRLEAQPIADETAPISDEAIREANLRIPLKEAAREIAATAVAQRDTCLKACIESVLRCGELTDENLAQVLQNHQLARVPDEPGDEDINPAPQLGETWLVDGQPVLWSGPVTVERHGDDMRGNWVLQLLIPLPQSVLARLPEGVRPYR